MTTAGLTCLVVDDQERLRRALARQLEAAGYKCAEAASGAEAVALLDAHEIPLVISDIRMPVMDGVALLKVIRERWPDTAVIMVTGVAEVETAVSCLHLGAYDYISKPYQSEEVRARIERALEKRQLRIDNHRYQHHLAELVEQQALRIEELFLEGVQVLVHALEAKDAYTHGHSTRVSAYAARIAAASGLPPDEVQLIELGAALHDVGKIGVREEVLRKPARLTDEEYRHIMEHTVIGERILAPLLKSVPGVLAIVRSHHERWDGRGVPDGLSGEGIPFYARIVAVADAFDAMTTGRPYRPGRAAADAIRELEDFVRVQFDPAVVEAFRTAYPETAALPIPTPAATRIHLPKGIARGSVHVAAD